MNDPVWGLGAALVENIHDDVAAQVLADALEEAGFGTVATGYASEASSRDLLVAWQALSGDDWALNQLLHAGSLAPNEPYVECMLWMEAAQLERAAREGGAPAVLGHLWEMAGRPDPCLRGRASEMRKAVAEGRMDPSRPWYGVDAADFARLCRWTNNQGV